MASNILPRPLRSLTLFQRNFVASGALLVASLIGSSWVGVDSNWDLFNYHAYNGLAVIQGRMFRDVAPASVQGFLNPLFDIPIGITSTFARSAILLSIWLAISQWYGWLAVWRLAQEIVRWNGRGRTGWLLFAFAIIGSCAMSTAFTSFNDWWLAAFVCDGLRLLFTSKRQHTNGDNAQNASRSAIVSGAAFGVALAVKLTATPYVFAGLVVAALCLARPLLKRWFVGLLLTVLATSGPWAVYLFLRYRSPFFPLYNETFRSQSATLHNFDDPRYGARTLQDLVRFPFDLAKGSSRYGEFAFREWRFAALLIVCAYFAIHSTRVPTIKELFASRLFLGPEGMMLIFIAVSFPLWVVQLGYYRYFLVIEILISFLLVLILQRTFISIPSAVVIALALAGASFQSAPNWGRHVSVHTDALKSVGPGRSLLLADFNNSSYLAASIPRSSRIASISGFASGDLAVDGPIGHGLKRFIGEANAKGSLLILVDPSRPATEWLTKFGAAVVPETCETVMIPTGVRQMCQGGPG